MKKWMKAALLSSTLIAGIAQAQTLYISTQDAADQGLQLTRWGNGLISQSDDVAFDGINSLRISTRNFFQGGIISFANPINLGSAFNESSNLLLFNFNVPGSTSVLGSGGPAGGPGGGPAGIGRPGGGDGGGGGPAGAPAGLSGPGGLSGGGQASSTQENVLERVRIVVATSDGKRSEGYLNVDTSAKDARGWFSVGIPLKSIAGFERTNKDVVSVAIAGDATATFYVGGIKILNDQTPVYAEPTVREMNLAFGDEVELSAFGSAGATPIKYIWDFDSRDGVDTDAEGQTVKRRFRNPGEFEVTLTAVDIYGLKKPHVTKIKVVVNP